MTLVVPTRAWSDYLFKKHAKNLQVAAFALEEVAAFMIEKYSWHFLVLEDMGIDVMFGYIPGS